MVCAWERGTVDAGRYITEQPLSQIWRERNIPVPKPRPLGRNARACLLSGIFLICLNVALNLVDYYPREKNPHSFTARHNLAVALVKMGQTDEAYEQEKEALQGIGNNNRVKEKGHLLMATVRMSKGRDDLAAQSLKAALIVNPYSAPAYKLLARIYAAQGARENAEVILKVAINLKPDDAESWEMLKAVHG